MKIKAENARSYMLHLKALAELKLINYDGDHRGFMRLRRLESKAHRLTTLYCNGDIYEDAYRIECEKLIKDLPNCVWVNGDARIYALKVDEGLSPDGMYRDGGGDGIVAPEF